MAATADAGSGGARLFGRLYAARIDGERASCEVLCCNELQKLLRFKDSRVTHFHSHHHRHTLLLASQCQKTQGRKRKHQSEPKYDREEEEQQQQQDEEEEEEVPLAEKSQDPLVQLEELPGIPIVSSELKTDKPNVIFILERASLEVAKVGKTYQLLNSDDHSNFLRKNNKNPGDYRPDITHQALLSILDSPLNKAGRLRAVYIKTEKGVLIAVKPFVRIPRPFKRFSGVMLELLRKLSISAAGKREKLLRTIKNPVTQYLPVNSREIGLSYSSDKLVNMNDYISTFPSNTDLVFVVGAMAHGKIETDYTEHYIAISGYPLSAAY